MEIKPVSPKGNQSCIFIGRAYAEAEGPVLWPRCEELIHLKRPWCWERLKVGGEGDDRGWDGWMASLTQWTWVWVDSRSWWWTGRPGMLWFMGSQRVGHNWATKLILTEPWQMTRYVSTQLKTRRMMMILWEFKTIIWFGVFLFSHLSILLIWVCMYICIQVCVCIHCGMRLHQLFSL